MGNRNGIITNLHQEVSDEEIDMALQYHYPGAKSSRLKKDGKTLNSVKITFASCDQLKSSLSCGIFVHPQHFSLEENHFLSFLLISIPGE